MPVRVKQTSLVFPASSPMTGEEYPASSLVAPQRGLPVSESKATIPLPLPPVPIPVVPPTWTKTFPPETRGAQAVPKKLSRGLKEAWVSSRQIFFPFLRSVQLRIPASPLV